LAEISLNPRGIAGARKDQGRHQFAVLGCGAGPASFGGADFLINSFPARRPVIFPIKPVLDAALV
jgi:hypothetical protein